MKKLFFIAFLTVLSCTKESTTISDFKVGDIPSESDYSNAPIDLELTTSGHDTVLIDTLMFSFKLDLEPYPDLAFIVEQTFLSGAGSNFSPAQQEIKIVASDKIQLLLHPGFENEMGVVKSSGFGELIKENQDWVNKDIYFYTQVQGNFRTAPRPTEDYIAFLYRSNRLGWVKIATEMNENWVIQKLSIQGFCVNN